MTHLKYSAATGHLLHNAAGHLIHTCPDIAPCPCDAVGSELGVGYIDSQWRLGTILRDRAEYLPCSTGESRFTVHAGIGAPGAYCRAGLLPILAATPNVSLDTSTPELIVMYAEIGQFLMPLGAAHDDCEIWKMGAGVDVLVVIGENSYMVNRGATLGEMKAGMTAAGVPWIDFADRPSVGGGGFAFTGQDFYDLGFLPIGRNGQINFYAVAVYYESAVSFHVRVSTEVIYRFSVTYNCIDDEWGAIEYNHSYCDVPETSWEPEEPNSLRYFMYTTDINPDLPDFIPTCYYEWRASYDCYAEEWNIEYVSSSASDEDETHDWEIDGAYYYKVTDTYVEPAPPESHTCYYYWEAYYNCSTSSWSIYNSYISSTGTISDWSCTLIEGWNSCSCVTTSSETPADPEGEPIC